MQISKHFDREFVCIINVSFRHCVSQNVARQVSALVTLGSLHADLQHRRASYAIGPSDAGVAASHVPAQVDGPALYMSRKYSLNIEIVASIVLREWDGGNR